jgi:flavin-dependent thymidylate synthase
MKVTLISHTPDAAELLIFTKNTRLQMTPGALEEIKAWPEERKLQELTYMANTIPSSWEFVDYVFAVEGVSRAYTHQQVRTRTASYAQQSMRVVKMERFGFVWPSRIHPHSEAYSVMRSVVDVIQAGYDRLVGAGVAPEDARAILPTNISTNIVCKFNLRTLAELARSRAGGRTQGEYRDVVVAMIEAVVAVHPWAEVFLAPKGRNYFDEIEAFAEAEFGGDLIKKGQLLKIVDHMRKEA